MALAGSRTPVPVQKASSADPCAGPRFANRDATFSPDGRWRAYSSNESGTPQVFVRSFPDKPAALFDASTAMLGRVEHLLEARFDVSADGQQFIIVAPLGGISIVSLTVTVNWMADLKK